MDFEGKQQSLLTFRIGPVLCCAPSLPVRSIITPPKLTHPPGSDSSQPGIFKHGSHIVKVIDLRQKFGVELSEQTQPGNLIITTFEKESFAFWVDQILDVFDFPTEGWGGLPAAIPRGVFSRILLLNNKIHLYSEFEKLASINDLGYLKQYIQQLKESEVKERKIKEQQTKKHEVKEKQAILDAKKEILVTKDINPEKVTSIKSNPVSEVRKTPNIKNNNTVTASKDSKTLNPAPAHNVQANKIKTPAAKTRIVPTVNPSVEKQQQKIKPTTASAQDIKNSNDKTSINVNNKNEVLNKEPLTPHSSINVEDESSSFGVIVLFILILSSLTAGGYFLFIDITSNNYKTTQKPSSVNTEVENTIEEPSFLQTDDFEEIFPIQQQIYAETENKSIDDKDTKTINTSLSIQNMETKNKNNAVIKNTEEKLYRADISQQDNDITITLHQPIKSEEPHQAEAVITAQPLDDNIITEKALGTPSVKKLKESELKNGIKPKKTINVIIHIVVKGDTLWAIAKKHVHNPFLYPELARLSNIKNPHRIYPGNRVRIRFITK